ncbi:MAG: tryptophanase, partial [Bacteroidales bacterium]|nr:tryptophanase [Bacteroidales bacterium]
NIEYTSFQDRIDLLMDADFNTFHIPTSFVTFDMNSQNTSAVSHDQYSGLYIGDETYAGSRNFEHLEASVHEIFKQKYICPTHNLRGSIKLLTATMVKAGNVVTGNSKAPELQVNDKNASVKLVPGNDTNFAGNVDLSALESELKANKVPYIYIDLYADGYKAVSIENLKAVRALAETNDTVMVVDSSYIVSCASNIRKNVAEYKNKSLSEIVTEIAATAQVLIIDAGQDPRSNAGGLIATNIKNLYDMYMNEVVVYEGLHTYGGMAGRTMEIFARGIKEMVYEKQASWILFQIDKFADQLKGIPFYKGADGIYIEADKFLKNPENAVHTLSAALYLKSGIRAFVEGKFNHSNILPVRIPRMGFTNDQLSDIAKAINELYAERNIITPLMLQNKPVWNDEAIYKWKRPLVSDFTFNSEPFTVQHIEYIGETTEEQRLADAKEAGYNTFLLQSKHIAIDFLTDSGTSAQSTDQWAEYMTAIESQATSDSYYELVEILQRVTGYKYIIPTHQGRAAEHIMSQCLIKDGFVPGNMYFTTTKLHQEMAGGTFADIIVDEAHNPQSTFRWKGNVDLNKLKKVVDEHGADKIPYISFEFSVNLAGGQPVSMDNAKEVYEYCEANNIYLMWDATRCVENAYMIKKYDEQYHDTSIQDILHEMFSYGHGCTVSSKKDNLVNIGGFLGIKDDEVFFEKAQAMLRTYEGSVTNGGLSSADVAVLAQGSREMLNFNYIKNRVEQTHYLGEKLLAAGIPIVEPIGSHAVFLDAKRFLPHIDQDNYPAQALATALFVDSGLRAMERGNVSKGRKPSGENYRPALELVRLTIPRRAYTNAHMDMVAESIIKLYKKRDQIKGLEFVYEPEKLRFFQGRFKEVD